MGSPRAGIGLTALVAAVVSCLATPADDGGEDTVIEHLPVTCAPRIERYPIAGRHNGGYDRNWSNFTCHPHPSGSPDNSDWGGAHEGNDLFAARGTPVVAVRAGRVTRAGVASSISGNRVTIEDSCGWSYYYGHLNAIASGIRVGVRVTAGQQIGTVGNTGATGTAPHVHFNVHRDGNYSNDTDPFPLLRAADDTACDGVRCPARCDANVLVERDCDRVNCASRTSRCVDDDLAPRCVFNACRPQGTHETCWSNGRYIGRCRNGQLVQRGDCGRHGSRCEVVGNDARCVFHACRPDGRHGTCWGNGRYVGQCRDGELVSQGDCSRFGARCVSDSLGARCVFFACPPTGEREVCWQGVHTGRCRNGALVSQERCGEGLRAVCDDLGARCVLPDCRAARGESSVCAPNGRIMQCRDGVPTGLVDCPAMGARCVMTGASSARCVRPTEPPPPPFDAGPVVVPDGGADPDVGFPLPDGWTPLPEDASVPGDFDVLEGADVPGEEDVPGTEDVDPFFEPDGGLMRAEVLDFEPFDADDGKDPCAECRLRDDCGPACGGAAASGDAEPAGGGCRCHAGPVPFARGASPWLAALAMAALRRRRRR